MLSQNTKTGYNIETYIIYLQRLYGLSFTHTIFQLIRSIKIVPLQLIGKWTL